MLKQNLQFKLSQKLSPQQIQLMKLIQLPTQAFEQRLQEELVENPALEESSKEEEYDQDIDLELVALEPKERIPQLMSGEVDIVCDASSFTWERDRAIDFSFSYGSTGTRLLTKRGNKYWDPQSLVGVRIGALAQTTNEQAIRRFQPKAEIVLLKDRAEGFAALREGKIDAFASDEIGRAS